ncbi:MAG: zinc-ribbon domain-containing protein [Deltaproteobacteria bacterium]|nr:zinc-ribbon domain-containing protein [Deltaproteobacteria bacterium]
MQIVCKNCKTKFRVPDEKLPRGQIISLKCPKCKNKIQIDTTHRTQDITSPVKQKTIIDQVASDTYDASEKPFDFLEEGVETALVCEHDQVLREKIHSALQRMGYHVTMAESSRIALKYMRFHVFELVVLDENFDGTDARTNHVLQYLGHQAMNTRRNIFVVLLGNRFRTGDNMIAFNNSVNLVINTKNMDDLEKILKRALTEHREFYQVFKETLKKTGRA